MRQQFIIDVAGSFQAYVYEDNRISVPTSATITIYEPGKSTEFISATAMVVAADGLLSYSLTTSNNEVADENYKAVIRYVHDSVTHTVVMFYDVVRAKIVKVITDEDLINELPQLKDKGWTVHGDATSGTTTTIVDLELQRYPDNHFTGGTATSLDKQEVREITDFVSSTGTVTTTAFSGAIATDAYLLQQSYTNQIQRAFEKIEGLLVREGRRAHLILDSEDLREVHILQSVSEVCKGFASESEELWWNLWQDYKNQAYAVFKSLNLKYDESDDGFISSGEEDRVTIRTTGRG